jgi:DNA modification methylase
MTKERKNSAQSPAAFASGFNTEIKTRNRERRSASRRLAATQAAAGSGRNDLLPPLELVDIRLDDLKLSQRRLRKRDPAHIREVANSIARLGYSKPILIGPDNEVIDGETVIEGVRLLGLDHLSCIRVGHLNDSERRLLRLAINRLAEKGEWDFEALRLEFNELILVDAPIEIGGFAPDEIDQILSLDPDDSVERTSLAPEAGAEPVARFGDLYRLGPLPRLRRRHGRRRSVPSHERRREAAPWTSRGGGRRQPFARPDGPDRRALQRPIAGNVTGGRHREFAMASGEMSAPEYLAFNETWMAAALPYLANGGLLATFIDWRGYSIVDAAAVNLGLAPVNLVVWSKTNAGMGSLYRSQHELLPLFKKGDAPHINNVRLGKRGRWRSNIWTYPGASSLGSDARRGLAEHPTVKPTAMLEDALIDLTERGDIVLDPFLGSGSTLIAAHRTGRVCRGVEIDPLYVDLIIRRFETETGENAVLMETGETRQELAARRAGTAGVENRSSHKD